jgi:hypothetical protein
MINNIGYEQIRSLVGQCYIAAPGNPPLLRLDSVALAIPSNIITLSIKKGKTLGLHYIGYDTFKSAEIWDCSAKVLKESYADLIHRNNIDLFVSSINGSGVLKVDPSKFYDKAMVLTADFTLDLHFEDPNAALRELSICPISRYYYRQFYGRGYIRETVLFCRKAKSKASVSFYNKYIELDNKENAQLLSYIDHEVFKNIIRMECRFNTLEEFRKVFGDFPRYEQPMLKDLLESNANPFLSRFNQIVDFNAYKKEVSGIDNSNVLNIFPLLKDRREHRYFCFIYTLYQVFGGNIDDINGYLKVNSKSLARDREILKQYLPYITSISNKTSVNIINSILEKIGGEKIEPLLLKVGDTK